jgi:hypothetical protein
LEIQFKDLEKEKIYHQIGKIVAEKVLKGDLEIEELDKFKRDVQYVFSSTDITSHYMQSVINRWSISSQQNLSNLNMNRVAWIGQAACCIYSGVPSKATMRVWKMLDVKDQLRSDNVAIKIIRQWEQDVRLSDISRNGSDKAILGVYQTKLL